MNDPIAGGHIAALRRDFPAIDELLQQYGDGSVADYLSRIRHRDLPEILPADDLLDVVRSYLQPVFGQETAAGAAALLGRHRCFSTSNHHHLAFDCRVVQDALLYEQWLRKNGERNGLVPIFAASNVHLQNPIYSRGVVLYDCALPEKRLKLPLFPHKMKHCCVGGVGKITPAMVQAAQKQLVKVKQNGTIRPAMFLTISGFYEDILLSDAVQDCGSYREQTTIVNALLSQRYFTDRSPQYLWMDLETITSKLLQKDLQQEDSIPSQILFHPALRDRVMAQLDGVSGCWTRSSAGTHFFWGLDRRAVLFALHLESVNGETVLTGTDTAGRVVSIPFAAGPICAHLEQRTLLPSLFLDFLELHFLRNYTVFGGYYQPTYLKQMQTGLANAFDELRIFQAEAEIIRQKISYSTFGPLYLVRDRGNGAFPVSTAELLEQPISTPELEEALQISLMDSYAMLAP